VTLRFRSQTLYLGLPASVALLLCCVWGQGCSVRFPHAAYTLGEIHTRKGTNVIISVSFISLVANPEKYSGKTIHVSGFLSLRNERSALFYTSEQMQHDQMADALWIEMSPEWFRRLQSFDRRFCRIAGRFDMSRKGHFGMYSGSLTEIEQVTVP